MSPARVARYSRSTARWVFSGIRCATMMSTHCADRPGFSRASMAVAGAGVMARIDNPPRTGVRQIRAIRCHR